MKKELSPEGIPMPSVSKPVTTSGLPLKDTDFMDVARAVATSWLGNPGITLAYTNASEFNDVVQAYVTELTGRLQAGSVRPAQTQDLDQLDATIDLGVREVKVYVEKKYKKANAVAHFNKFGIGKSNGTYQLPRDRNKRMAALALMAESINGEGFGEEEYGLGFWNQTVAAYQQAMALANTSDGSVSVSVSGKNNLKRDIKKVMKSLRRVLEGNYPETFRSLFREWGWQKEDY